MSSPTIIVVNGRRTRVRVEGDATEPPIVLLHGIGRSLEDWEPQHFRLTDYRTIALDMPGFGFSNRPSGPMSLPVLAQAVVETLDVLGEQPPAHVMGNSLAVPWRCNCWRYNPSGSPPWSSSAAEALAQSSTQ